MGVNERIEWPNGREFAFTVFDDPDAQTYETTRILYSFLADIGLQTTVAVWPLDVRRQVNSGGETCANPEYREFLQELQRRGFEIGFHHAFPHSATREETIEALETFRRYFGDYPRSMANHYNEEAIYWGSARVGGWRRFVYNLTTRWKNEGRFFGHVPGHGAFWGDICQQRIRYCRNFVFSDINTLAATPFIPYSDPARPYVNEWFSSSEGHQAPSFLKTLAEPNQDRLQAERGGCIMYTHFGHGFVRNGQLNPEFRRLMERIAKKPGWFVPVSTLLDFLRIKNGATVLDPRMRRSLETRWLWEKLFRGTS